MDKVPSVVPIKIESISSGQVMARIGGPMNVLVISAPVYVEKM